MKDYPVIEINDKTVKARLRDKQGKHQTDMLDVVTVEEENRQGATMAGFPR
jgi:hypothetical protein